MNKENKNIESIYPLSPMQQGMLFHSLYAPDSGVYFEQLSCTLYGNLNATAFERAWQRVVERHPVLRTLFVWEHRKKPLQVVRNWVNLPWVQHDWRGLSSVEQQERLEAFLKADREQGFELDQAPLMRCALIQIAEDSYQFVWSHHHLLMDGWSSSIILKEVFTFYEAFKRTHNLYLDAPRPYQDYITWLQQQDLSQAEAFWRQVLQGFTAPTPLFGDRAVNSLPNQKETYNEQHLQLSVAVTAALHSLARQHHLTLNTLIQGAWALLLSRYSGESDVVFGATVSGRPHALSGVESMVGLFINTLPVRVQVSGEASLLSWLQQMQAQQVEREQYSYSPLVEIQGCSDVPRGLPLFESIVVFENYPVDASLREQGGSLEIRNVRAVERTNYPLTVVAAPGEELSLQLSYDCRRFDAATITRMLGHFQTMLEGIVAHPEQRLADLPLLTLPERHQLLVEWNDTQVEYPQDKCIHQLFEAQVERTPEAVAVVFEDQQLTYRELNRRANQLAHRLLGLGIGPEVLVGICVERSIEIVVGLLGILKAGGAYVPLDPTYPQERLAFMLEDAQVPVLLTQQRLVEGLPKSVAPVFCLDSGWEAIDRESEENPASEVTADNLAYVIYTSGSTGKPKGVTVPHRAVNRLVFNTNYVKLEPSDRVAQASNASFDAATFEIWGALLHGARLVGIAKDVTLSPQEFAAHIREQQLSVLFLTTALFNQLASVVPEAFNSLRHLLFGGEAVDSRWVKEVLKKGPPQRLLHVYGPTEGTTFSSWHLVQNVPEGSTTFPIGRPIANTQIYILDRQLQPVPIGVPGELHIGGAGLARGYLNRPDLTKEKFIPNPFSDDPGVRLYKTGDLARYLSDGNIEFLGRIDHQVKIRGLRIELGEIEAVLAQHPAVRKTVAIAREDHSGDKRLVAYVVPNQEQGTTPGELFRFLKEKLPDYMVPSAFVMLEALPLTPNGKVDRRALPTPEPSQRSLEEGFVAPRTPTEEVLAAIWADILGLEQVGIYDNFFGLGGHSLLATQFMSRVREAFQVDLPLHSLFESPTVAGLSEHIEAAHRENQSQPVPPIRPVFRDGELPLSFAQQRLWFLDQLEGGSATYNIPAALKLIGPLHIASLEQSLTEIVRRHEALRTTFPMVNGSPVQAIAHTQTFTLPVVDLQALPEGEQSAKVRQLAIEEAQRPFDLANGPLLRVTLLRLSEESHVLLETMHHIVSDGWSVGIFIREVATLYEAFSKGAPSPLPALPIQYADFAHWQRQWLKGEVLETQLTYWKQQLTGAPPLLELPTDRPRPPVQTFRGSTEPFQLNPDLTRRLLTLSQQSGATLFMTLLSAFVTLLFRYSSQEDVVVGSPIANRNRSETESIIGFFVNTLVLRTHLQGNPTFQQLLSRVRQAALDAYAHQDVPFEQVVEALQPERNLSHTPLFQVMFVLQNAPMGRLELPGLTLTPLEIDSVTAKFDLTLSMTETEQGLIGSWEYNSDLFDATTITRMAGHFQTLLEGIVANPQQRLFEFPLLTAAERHQLLVEWNDTQAEYPQDKCIHQLFEVQLERTPNAVAVVFEDQQLTYRQLNCRANQLAHHLQALGVGPEVLVGLCVERSLEMVVGLLSILKAGGGYVPLDPAYPQERLAFMLEDARVSVLLTQEKLVAGLPEHRAHVVCLDTDWEVISQGSEKNPVRGVIAKNLAYVIYTSGSTSKPKGVMINHRSLVNAYQASEHAYQLRALATSHLQMASFSFDVFSGDLIRALCSGAKLVICPREWLLAPEKLYKLMREEKVDCAEFVPAVLRNLVQYLEKTEQNLNFMRLLVVGSDSWYVNDYEEFQRFCGPDTRFINSYGVSEATIDSTYFESTKVNLPVDGLVPIGRPFANTQIYILDRDLQPVPIGVPGELHIGGAGLARGYLNRPELTEEKFIPNPFSDEPGARLYKTGDLAYYLPDGNIKFLGRLDNQVKIRGFRIELGEIEAVLTQHPVVRETVVLAQEDAPSDRRLVAYVVANEEQEPTASELRRFLKEKLPEYMVPSAFVMLEAFPLTPNGKLDRRALPAPDPSWRGLEEGFVAPRTPTEEVLAAIWADILGLKQVGIYDNFFELGGHSLLATQVISRLREEFQVDLSLRALFERSTTAELAELVIAKQFEQAESDALKHILTEVDELSDDEVKKMLLAQYE